jgi:hypothetical protein
VEPVPNLRARLSAVLGRHVGAKEAQAEILVQLLETLERQAENRRTDERERQGDAGRDERRRPVVDGT